MRDGNFNHGYVLIFSLWAIVILGFIAFSFTRSTAIAIKTEIAYTGRVKNIYAARGACVYATQMLVLPKKQKREKKSGQLQDRTDSGKKGSKKRHRKGDPWAPSMMPYPVQIGDRNCEVFISDESGKINVNKLTDDTRINFVKFLTSCKLQELVAETITDSILDWLDKDELHHANGAEKEYYSSLPEPYEPKNGPFESLEELTLVKGVTPEIFEMLRSSVTIYGSGKINVNYAEKETLLFVPAITQEMATSLFEAKKKVGRIDKLDDLREFFRSFGIIGTDFQKILEYVTIYDSNYMTITAVSSFDKMKNSYKIVVLKSVDHCRVIAAYPE